jgi:hypothetical protein
MVTGFRIVWRKKGAESPEPGTNKTNGDKQDKCCVFCKKKGHTDKFCWKKKKFENEQNSTGNKNDTVNAVKVSNFLQKDNRTDVQGQRTSFANQTSEKIMMLTCKDTMGYTNIDYKDLFLADSGALHHFVTSLDVMTDVEEVKQTVTLPNSYGNMQVTHIGTFHGTCIHMDGTKMDIQLRVKYIPGLSENIISITKAICNGWTISNNKDIISLSKGGLAMKFDPKDYCGAGWVMYCKIVPNHEKLNS